MAGRSATPACCASARRFMLADARGVVVVAIAMVMSACSTTTAFRSDKPTEATLIVDEHDYGALGDGKDVPVTAGYSPLHWTLVDGGQIVAEGDVERDQVSWGVVLGAGAAAACCVPSMAVSGFCLANPALLAAPITLLVNPGVIVTTCQAPGWLSVPFTAVGAGVGSMPLFFGLLGQHPPPEVTLTAPPPLAPMPGLSSAPAAPSAPSAPTPTPSSSLRHAPNPPPLARAAGTTEAMCF